MIDHFALAVKTSGNQTPLQLSQNVDYYRMPQLDLSQAQLISEQNRFIGCIICLIDNNRTSIPLRLFSLCCESIYTPEIRENNNYGLI